MGQYRGQPDFATKAVSVEIGVTKIQDSALYIGTGGDIEVVVVNGSDPVVFKNIPNGSFLPVIVNSILPGANTTVSDIIAIK